LIAVSRTTPTARNARSGDMTTGARQSRNRWVGGGVRLLQCGGEGSSSTTLIVASAAGAWRRSSPGIVTVRSCRLRSSRRSRQRCSQTSSPIGVLRPGTSAIQADSFSLPAPRSRRSYGSCPGERRSPLWPPAGHAGSSAPIASSPPSATCWALSSGAAPERVPTDGSQPARPHRQAANLAPWRPRTR
jgi:hypothetical protein